MNKTVVDLSTGQTYQAPMSQDELLEIEEAQAKGNEEAKTQCRRKRGQLLTASDWTQLGDSTADKATWATYRQALRDIPAQAGFPWTIDWPDAP
jgi:hypothetical protein